MAGDVAHAGRKPAMGQRNSRRRGAALRRGDAGDDLIGNAGALEFGRFLAAAAENEGVAALQPHHGPAGAAEPHQHLVDFFLRHRMEAGLLADIDPGRAIPDRGEDAVRHEPVVDDDIGLPRSPAPPSSVSSSGSPGPAPTR